MVEKSNTPSLNEIEAVTIPAPDPLTNLNESLLAKTSNHGLSSVPKVELASLGIMLPEIPTLPDTTRAKLSARLLEIISEPLIECDPVKCLKLLSTSSIVKAEPLPGCSPEPVLYVNAIFYLIYFVINIKKNLQGTLS